MNFGQKTIVQREDAIVFARLLQELYFSVLELSDLSTVNEGASEHVYFVYIKALISYKLNFTKLFFSRL